MSAKKRTANNAPARVGSYLHQLALTEARIAYAIEHHKAALIELKRAHAMLKKLRGPQRGVCWDLGVGYFLDDDRLGGDESNACLLGGPTT